MRLLIAALLGLLALQACCGQNVHLNDAESLGLDDEEKAIVNGFLDLIQGVIAAGGDLDQIQDTLDDIKGKVGRKLRVRGPDYLQKLAQTLSKVHISEENVANLVTSINNMAEKNKAKSRSRRSPEPTKKKKKFKKFKKGKKGKKGCGK